MRDDHAAWLAKILDEAHRFRQRATELNLETRAAHATGHSLDGLIEATVTATGRLTALHINPRAMRVGSQHLAQSILEATSAAATQAVQQTQQRYREVLGPDFDLSTLGDGLPDQ